MKVYRYVDFYIGLLKPEITGKQQFKNFRKTQKQQLTENQKKYNKPKKYTAY